MTEEQAEITGGAHLARALRAEGITRVFGIPGTHNLEIFAQLAAEGISSSLRDMSRVPDIWPTVLPASPERCRSS